MPRNPPGLPPTALLDGLEASPEPDAKPGDGSFQAMDQIAHWVRFADTKATILTAGLGVVMTMLMTNSGKVAAAFTHGFPAVCAMVILGGGAATAFVYTLFWLTRAIGPQSQVPYISLNRFAWPTLSKVTPAQLREHAERSNVSADAWQQVIDLSGIAQRKFAACGQAVKGFAVLVVLAVACVATAIAITHT